MTPFPRLDYATLHPYDPGRTPIPVDLSDNTNLWGPHPAALEAVRSAPPEALTRYPSVYAGALKDAIAERFRVPAGNVTTGCGSDDLLDSGFRAAVVPPGRMAFPEPTFSMVEAFARMNGMDPRGVPFDEAVQDPAALLRDAPDLIYLCSPNNPTGLPLGREWVMELLSQAGSNGPLVVLDEAYADFAGETLLQEALTTPRLLVLRTLSKLYGLAGMRVGFGVGTLETVAEVEKSRGPYKVSQLAERAAVAALTDRSGWAEGIVAEAVANRERLTRALRDRGYSPLPSRANFLLIPLTPTPGAEEGGGTPDARGLNEALKARGVAARPFPALPGIGEGLRVTVGPWEMMETFLEALDQIRTVGPGRRPSNGGSVS